MNPAAISQRHRRRRIRKALARFCKANGRAPKSGLAELLSVIAKVRVYHGTQRKFAPAAMRPSATGLYGPGIYATSNREHSKQYGKHTHAFEVDENRFVAPKDFDRRNRRIRSGAKTAAVFRRAGYHGVRDGDTYAVWSPSHIKNHTVERRRGVLHRLGLRKSKGRHMANDVFDALNAAFAKARYRTSGGVGLSSKQRRNLAIGNARAKNTARGFSAERGPHMGSRHKLSPAAAFLRPKPARGAAQHYTYNGRSQVLRAMLGSKNKAAREDALQNARNNINRGRKDRGLAPKYKRGVFSGRLKPVRKAAPKTLYVYRPVENAEAIIAWAKAQGFGSTLRADDMHVTVAFSKTPLNWARLGDDWCAEDPSPAADTRACCEPVSYSMGGQTRRTIKLGAREVKALGDKGAVVLAFQSPSLTERWAQFLRIGASWSFAGYTPHITITYKGGDLDLSNIEPYAGEIILGDEHWEEVKDGVGDDVAEVDTGVKKSRLAASSEAIADRLDGLLDRLERVE